MKFIFSLLVSVFALNANAVTLISDLDDTIKHTHVGNVKETVKNGLFSKVPFGGMAALYTAWASELTVVSGSPKQMRRLVVNFLEDADFPPADLYLRRYLWDNIEHYKNETLSGIIASARGEVVLVGDDTEKDPEIYLQMKSLYPKKVSAIYIRRVKGRALPGGVTGFYHPFEIAVKEWTQRRLPLNSLIAVGKDMDLEFLILPRLYFPDHVVCPKTQELLQFRAALESNHSELVQLARSAANRTSQYCFNR